MRFRPRYRPLCLLPILATACIAEGDLPKPAVPPESVGQTQSALGGIEGSFEAALDAPWRIEPVLNKDGAGASYGGIPIQVSIHDANQAASDSGRWDPPTGTTFPNNLPTYVATHPQLGNFCELTVRQPIGTGSLTTRKSFSGLTDVESTTGSWKPGTATPPHAVCFPASGQACSALQDVGPTSEWHASTWFYPKGDLKPGTDIPLELKARLTRDPATTCDDPSDKKFLTITNNVRVHLGEAPLPRFDNGWLYGDVHYHSQGTDNEGEAGYNYRGVMRAIGAMGVDFALASDHASSSEQFVDGDVDVAPFSVTVELHGDVLRDLNATRHSMLHGELWNASGVNAAALVGPSGTALPQGYLSHGVVPRVFLGGEVDVIPEIDKGWDGRGYTYGNGLRYDIDHLCGGWFYNWITVDGDCDTSRLRVDAPNSILFGDSQGMHNYGMARAHIIYMPRESKTPDNFVGSFTGKYGGGGRRMVETYEGHAGVLPEIEKNNGYAFLAHPGAQNSCSGKQQGDPMDNGALQMSNLEGSMGPDIAPYTPSMLTQAFQSQAVLGLEFWNEDTRLCTKVGQGDSKEVGFNAPGDYDFKKLERVGFGTGEFGLSAFFNTEDGQFQNYTETVEWSLHHGAKQWDEMLLRGIDPVEMGQLKWLTPGEPRRVYMAGGSDAHGDLNYRREGYMLGTTTITDTALAKVRNLVYAGAPDVGGGRTGAPGSHSQTKVIDALGEGNFAVTDGPAMRIVVDRNRNGIIDATDTPMGGVVELHGETTLPLLVEWISTREFGAVTDAQLVVDVQSGGGIDGRSARSYSIAEHGPRADGVASPAVVSSYSSNGLTYQAKKDGYYIDPTGLLKIPVSNGLHEVRRIDLPVAAFQSGKGIAPERLLVRAFAQTKQKDPDACTAADQKAIGRGACIRRYAFTNPVWAMPAPRDAGCKAGPRAMDRDGDGIPDGCDPCPDTRALTCKVAPRTK